MRNTMKGIDQGKMKLRLDIDEVIMTLEIRGWIPEDSGEKGDHWTRDHFALTGDYVHYSFDNEALACREVAEIRDLTEALLEGNLITPEYYEPMEGDFWFLFSPACSDPASDLYLWLTVCFPLRDGTCGSNTFSMTLGRKEIRALYHYFCLVTGELDPYDEEISKLAEEGVLVI